MRPVPNLPGVEIRHLRLMVALAEHGSLTTVSRHLNVTQPALSHQLRDLETGLGAPLFERTSRRMVLTPLGEHLTHVARRMLADLDAFERQVSEGEFSAERGKVRLATECYTAYHWLPSVLRDFRKRWPKVELRVAPERGNSPITALREGTLDLAIVYRRTPERQIRFEPLFDDEMVVVHAPDHRFAGADNVSIKAVSEEHLFTYVSLSNSRSAVGDILDSANAQPSSWSQVQLTEAIVELVAAGFGVSIMATWAVAPAVRAGIVKTTRLGKQGQMRTWYAAMRSSDITPAFQIDLIDMLRRHLSTGRAVVLKGA
jgi:LysR family transcriptional regulator, regulator for metE and metH